MSLLFQREPAHSGATETRRDTRRVVARLSDGEEIVLAETTDRAEALEVAQSAVRAIDAAVAAGRWAELDDHLIRPDTIESIDVELVES